jgi:hypothetical protein
MAMNSRLTCGLDSILRRADCTHEARRTALERNIWPSLGVGGRQEEIDRRFDEALVVIAERGSRQAFQDVGQAAAAELVLKRPIADVVEASVSHGDPPGEAGGDGGIRTLDTLLHV